MAWLANKVDDAARLNASLLPQLDSLCMCACFRPTGQGSETTLAGGGIIIMPSSPHGHILAGTSGCADVRRLEVSPLKKRDSPVDGCEARVLNSGGPAIRGMLAIRRGSLHLVVITAPGAKLRELRLLAINACL